MEREDEDGEDDKKGGESHDERQWRNWNKGFRMLAPS